MATQVSCECGWIEIMMMTASRSVTFRPATKKIKSFSIIYARRPMYAVETYVQNGQVIGLGTGPAINELLKEISARLSDGRLCVSTICDVGLMNK